MRKKLNKKIMILIVISIILIILLIFFRRKNNEDLFPNLISSISIEYYPFYNITTAESLNSLYDYNYIEKQIIQLKDEEINDIKKYINNIHNDSKEFLKCDCLINDAYKMIINNKYELIIDEPWGQYKYSDQNIIINIPDKLYDYILKKVDENNTKILKTIDANEISVEKDHKFSIVNKKNKDEFLNNFSYLEVNIDENYLTYDNGYIYVLYFDNSKILYLYSGCVIGYLVDNNSNYNSYVLLNGITEKDINNLLSNEENIEPKIKYLEYKEENGYAETGIKFIINIDKEISAKMYYLSQETFEYEQVDNQIWTKQKWIDFENELYASGLENWKINQEESDKSFQDYPTDCSTYSILIVFNDDSKLQLSADCMATFKIDDILNKYFNNYLS